MSLSKKLLLGAVVCGSFGSAFALPLGNPADPALYTRGLILRRNYCDDACNPCNGNGGFAFNNNFNNGCCDAPCDPCGTSCGGSWFDNVSFRIGYYGDFVFQRHTKRDSPGFQNHIEHTTLNTNAALFVLNVCQRADVFATWGATHAEIETLSDNLLPLSSTLVTRPRVTFELGTNSSWSVGARAVAWQFGCTTFGVEGQYFATHLDLERATAAALFTQFPKNVKAKYREWQVGAGIAHRINFLVPYVGVKYARAKADLGGAIVLNNFVPNLRSAKHWGFVAGVTLVDCGIATVTAEGRWGDEKALHINGQIRF